MAKLKHIALSLEKTARFYMEVFGMKEIAKIDATGHAGRLPDRRRHQPRELNFKKDTAAGVERGKGYSGIHHIGFQVESLEEITERRTAAGSQRRDDVNEPWAWATVKRTGTSR